MTEVSKPLLKRGGIVAAAGILIGTVCQASLRDVSPCRPSDPDLSGAISASAGYAVSYDAPLLSNRESDGVRQACAASDSHPQRARVVEPDFVHAIVAGGARLVSN